MADRSVVVRLRAEIGDLKSKMNEAANLTKKVGEVTEQANKKASDSDKVRAAVRKQAADAEIRSNEQLLIATEKYGKSAAFIDANSASISRLSNTALGLGAAVGVGVGATVKTFADFDKQMSSVAATGSDARTHIDELRKSAIDLGAASSFSASEAAAGVENLLKAGVSAADVMGGGLKGSLDLAAAGSMTVGDAAETAATALTQFKLSGKDVPHVADLLAAGAGKAQGEVSDMGQALNQSGLVASQFGLSIEDTTGTLAAFASAGLVGSDAGTSFRTMLLALANPSDKARESMHKLGIAAYDANGQFVGITNLAGQLRDKMGGLTQAQRDQALAQIFGNDAIRAANVLFEQGATGIDSWRDKVNDAGYASDTARIKMDNLAGDFEKLKGAMESAFINSGSGGNDALRGLTQQFTGLVEAVGNIPGPVLEASVGIAAVGAAGLLAMGGVGKLAVGIVDSRKAFADLADTSPRLAGALGTVGKAAGAAAAGLAVAELAGAAIDAIFRKNEPSMADAGEALVGLGQSGDLAASGMDKFFTLANSATNDIAPIQADVLGLSDSLDRLLNKSGGQKFNDMISGWLPGKDIAETLTDRFSELDKSLTGLAHSGSADQAAAGFRKIAEAAAAQKIPVDQLLTLFPTYYAALKDQATQLGVTNLSAQQYADWMGGRVPGAVRAAEVAAGAHAGALGGEDTAMLNAADTANRLTDAQGKLAQAQANLKTETDRAIASFTILNSTGMGIESASSGWEAALDNLRGAFDATGKSLAGARKSEGDAAKAVQRAEENLRKVRAGTKPTAEQLRDAEDKLKDAKVGGAQASRAVLAAEQKLQDLRRKGRASAADISSAEKELQAAKERGAAAAAATLAAEQRLLLTRADAGSTPAQVLAAEAAFRAAEDRQAAAGTAIQAAEEKLAAARSAKGKSSAADIKAAEDAVKTAKENAAKSNRGIGDAERNLDKVRRGTKPTADELRNAEDQLRDAKSRHADAANAASEAEKANSKTLDRNSESGRKNRKTVQDAIAALDEKVKADFKVDVQTMGVKAATDKATESMRKGRIKILDAADAAGFNRGEVKKMADQMLKTPKQVETQIHTPGMADALKKIKELQGEINDLKGKSVTITANFAAKADKAVAELNKKIVAKYGDKTSRRISVFSQGGPVWGAGTGTSDDIDAKLSNGEFVVKAQSVNKVGRDKLHHINQTGEVPHFATGGYVSRDINVKTRTRNAFSIASEPFKGQSKMLEDSAEEYMKGLSKAYVDALNDSADSYGAASPGKYGGSAFSAAQLANAATIASVGAGLGKKAILTALMTAMQESGLRNLNYGDRDSLGLFQQRAAWGSRAQRTDPRTSAGMFFHGGHGGQRGLDDIPGWRGMSPARAAQAVQVSAFPGAYAKWQDEAEDIMSAMSQFSGASGAAGTGSRKHVRWKGGTFTERFRNTLIAAEKYAGRPINVMQGGFSHRVAVSGTSHYGDAIDAQWNPQVLSGLRRAHVAAWHRTPAQGFVHHIHGVPLPGFGYPGGSGVWQAQDYKRGGNGLAYGGEVFGPGTGTSDSVWKRLSKGEWVVPAQQAQRLKPLLQDINKGRVTLRAASAMGGVAPAASTPTIVKAGDVIIRDSQFGADERKVAAQIQARQADSLAMAGLTVAI